MESDTRQVNFRGLAQLLDDFNIWCIKNKTTRTKAILEYMSKCVEEKK